jgi:hypothetical protein
MRKRAPDNVLINVAKLNAAVEKLISGHVHTNHADQTLREFMTEILFTCKHPHADRFLLEDVYDSGNKKPHVLGHISIDTLGIVFHFNGYGDCCSAEGHGTPVLIENREGVLYVVVWSDINREDPTHSICMEGAKESKRKEP